MGHETRFWFMEGGTTLPSAARRKGVPSLMPKRS